MVCICDGELFLHFVSDETPDFFMISGFFYLKGVVMEEDLQPRLSIDLVSQAVLECGGKYRVSVGVEETGSVVSEEQLMQKRAMNRNSVDFEMVEKIGFV
jgi:hypothetical protein